MKQSLKTKQKPNRVENKNLHAEQYYWLKLISVADSPEDDIHIWQVGLSMGMQFISL